MKSLLQLWKARRSLRRARRKAASGNWLGAATAYARHLALRPANGAAWIQYGHALKEAGNVDHAISAYDAAVRRMPSSPEAWLQLGLAKRLAGDRAGAVDAIARSVSLDAGFKKGVRELLALGGRARLGGEARDAAEQPDETAGRWPTYAFSRYPVYRDRLPLPGRPAAVSYEIEESPAILLIIDARLVPTGRLIRTLESMIGQSGPAWRALLIGADNLGPLPTGDPRIRTVEPNGLVDVDQNVTWLILVDGGATPDLTAVTAAVRLMNDEDLDIVYGDHDRIDFDMEPPCHVDPVLQPCFDPIWFSDPQVVPPLLLVRRSAIGASASWGALPSRFALLSDAAMSGRAGHVPLFLSSWRTKADPELFTTGTDTAKSTGSEGREPPADTIDVIVQTRDAAALLRPCIDTLRSTARHTDLLRIFVVDNRSTLEETRDLLRNWRERGIVTVISHDETFNWSRANNIGARRGSSPILLFLNNDTEMLSRDWDISLRARLSDRSIGIVGARLLYPDFSIQHAGIILGMETGGPVHEGVAREMSDPGPAGRWRRSRAVSAVTGAWFAMRREAFDASGGFDETLPVAFNDVDMCLRIRSQRLFVVEDVDIVAVHRESATRGLRPSAQDLERERGELRMLEHRWGEDQSFDPGYHPRWSREGVPFDGIRIPGDADISAWMRRSRETGPWWVDAPAPPSETSRSSARGSVTDRRWREPPGHSTISR